uniref:Uncharacterized protein n=1 Tax=Anguilla anguilla TaxID=7936 RepID=A0A0E9UWW2_ANGAN
MQIKHEPGLGNYMAYFLPFQKHILVDCLGGILDVIWAAV